MDIILRAAEHSDGEQIAAMVSGLALEHISSTLGDGGIEVLLASMDSASTRARIENKWLHICAFSEGNLVGVVVVKPQCHLYHLFVATEFQRQRIGSRLFAKADEATLASTGSALSTVNSSLNVVRVYERFGFVADGPIVDTDGVRCQPMVRRTGG